MELPRNLKTLKFQIAAAMLSLVALLTFSTLYTLSVVRQQRDDDAVLRLSGEMQYLVQSLSMHAMSYRENAPRDYDTYFRDVRLYYRELDRQLGRIDQLIDGFSSSRLAMQLTGLNHDYMPRFDTTTETAIQSLKVDWRRFYVGVTERFGSNLEEPRLEWGAEFIEQNIGGLKEKAFALTHRLEDSVQQRVLQADRLNRLVLVCSLAIAIGILVWFYRRVLNPLGTTVRGFHQVANGDFSHRVPVTGDNEIGWLSSAFNQLTERLDTLFRLTTRLQQGSDLDQTLEFVTESLPPLLPLDWVGVLIKVDDECLQLERAYDDGRPEPLSGPVGERRFPIAGTLLEECLAQNAPLHIGDVQELSLLSPEYRFLHTLAERERRDAIFLPISAQSSIPGVLVFATRQPQAYGPEQRQLLSNIALLVTLSFGRTLELAEHARLAVIGQFASSIAHEIRNPLATISLALDYLQQTEQPEAAQKRLDLGRAEVSRMERLLEDILLYAKPLQLNVEPIELKSLIPTLRAALNDEQRRRLEYRLEEIQHPIPVDRDRLVQILSNLLKNAFEASPPDGPVELIAVDDPGNHRVVLRVTNRARGSGLKEKETKRLFEPFFTTKASGTGLGLAIVRRLVEAHAGRVHAEFENETTSFVVELPTGMSG